MSTQSSTPRGSLWYRVFESTPGLLSWSILILTLLIGYFNPVGFVFLLFLITLYWTANCFHIVILARKGMGRIKAAANTDWNARLDEDFPDWGDYYYCTLLPFASESYNVLKPTIESVAASRFPRERRILCLGSEKAIPGGRLTAARIKEEFKDSFAYIFTTEHELTEGELKGKASNQNHCGRYLYDRIRELGIDPGKVLFTSNDADVLNDPQYPTYLLHTYLSAGPDRDCYIYQPIPTDYNNFWSAPFFSRIIVSTGVLWRIALQVRSDYRCTVYSFYSMTLKTLREIGFWDTDLIPEDEHTMFKAILAFGERFRVVPMFMLTRGSPVRGETMTDAFHEQYVQIRRWAWGASEFAYSMSCFVGASRGQRKALLAPILNQIRTSTEWSLSSLLLMFAGYVPGLFHPYFHLTTIGRVYPFILSGIMSLTFFLLIAMIDMDRRLAPPKSEQRGRWFSAFSYAQWLLVPVVGLVLSSVPAIESQTRLILNRRIAYVESRKEFDLRSSIQPHGAIIRQS